MSIWGIIPAAGSGSRIKPLAFSKELLPVGSRVDGEGEHPRAVSEYLVERMLRAGAEKLCFVVGPGKSDILAYYGGGEIDSAESVFVVQPRPAGLCDAIFRAAPVIGVEDVVVVGLPDTVWFPVEALRDLPGGELAFLLFPVERPELFDAVVVDQEQRVMAMRVKEAGPGSGWVWGAFKMPGCIYRQLHDLWRQRGGCDQYIGTLINAYLEAGGAARGVKSGRAYVDVGTVDGYREAVRLLEKEAERPVESPPDPETVREEAQLRKRVLELGPWFQNLKLAGVETAPHHFLGDYPEVKWRRFAGALPASLEGKTVLDIGCNAGFYALEMKRRGASRVVGIDTDETYLAQARFASEVCGLELELRQLSVYEVAELRERFDLVLFMGVFYHLRHPLLALERIREHVCKGTLVFQSMQRGASEEFEAAGDYDFWESSVFEERAFPKMHFVERNYAGDPTNWWIPNGACVRALLRSSGFKIVANPEQEVFLCEVDGRGDG